MRRIPRQWWPVAASIVVVVVGLIVLGAQGAPGSGEVRVFGAGQRPTPVQTVEAGEVWRVDLNRASRAELMALPGIGEGRAEAILAGRPFASLADVVERGVLPRAVAEELLEFVGVGP